MKRKLANEFIEQKRGSIELIAAPTVSMQLGSDHKKQLSDR